MIIRENRHDEYAYRVAAFELDPSVTRLEEGQWVTLQNGKLVIADGTKKAFIATGSKRAGRNQVGGVPVKQVSILVGGFILTVDQFDATGTYGELTPLKVKAGGILTPWISGTDKAEQIVAYSVNEPLAGSLRIISA